MRSIFILVPSFHPTGPVKGAIALANELVEYRDVTLVSLKHGPGSDAYIDAKVRQICLADSGNLYQRLKAYQSMLKNAGGRRRTASLSLCFSADMANLFCRKFSVTCASVRGNLPQNYRMHYDFLGAPLAYVHLLSLRGMDHVVAMTSAMACQVSRYIGRQPAVISNFIDEAALDKYRNRNARTGPFRFVFLASLTNRKRPGVLVDAISKLHKSGVDVRLDMIGVGPLMNEIAEMIKREGLSDLTTLHGHMSDPYPTLTMADALVLPSLSEGLSRACLEALFLGVPCVLRDIDGNRELVRHDFNGMLFKRDEELPSTMLSAARMGRSSANRDSLLPPDCAQKEAVRRYLELLEKT